MGVLYLHSKHVFSVVLCMGVLSLHPKHNMGVFSAVVCMGVLSLHPKNYRSVLRCYPFILSIAGVFLVLLCVQGCYPFIQGIAGVSGGAVPSSEA